MKGWEISMNRLQKEIANRNLPELMRLENGKLVTNSADWLLRREEIKKLLCHEYMGVTPDNIKSTFECVDEDGDAYGGKAIAKTIKVRLTSNNDAYGFPFKVILPKAVKEKIPTFLHLQFNELVAGGLGEEIIDNGYAIAHVCYQDVEPDDSRESFLGVGRFEKDRTKKERWGKIAMWAFGASRIMDYLQTVPQLDHAHIAVIGHSRLALTALWCVAMDERFVLAVAGNSGSLYRGSQAEGFRDLAREYTRYWFCPNLFRDDRDAKDLPFDMHFLLALIAPRYVYLTGATRDLWADAHSEVLSGLAANPAFEILGQKGLVCPDELLPDTPYHEGNIAFFLRTGTHFLGRDDWHAVMKYRKEKKI